MTRQHYGIEDSPTNVQTISPLNQFRSTLRCRLDTDCHCQTVLSLMEVPWFISLILLVILVDSNILVVFPGGPLVHFPTFFLGQTILIQLV